jgi:hypothetical protein
VGTLQEVTTVPLVTACASRRDHARQVAIRNSRTASTTRMAAAVQQLQLGHPVQVLTAKETAARLGVTVRQLNRYQRAGLITPQQNVPRGHRQFTEESVDALRRSIDGTPTP